MSLLTYFLEQIELYYVSVVYGWSALAMLVFYILLSGQKAPYGKFNNASLVQWWHGPELNGKFSWALQEGISPIVIIIVARYYGINFKMFNAQSVLLWQWVLHYVHRAFIYPAVVPSMSSSRLFVVLSASMFNVINASLNGFAISKLDILSSGNTFGIQFQLGLLVFLAGMSINVLSDYQIVFEKMKRANSPKKSRYFIPYGFLYNYVSCPNYFGEIIEWTGFALQVCSLTAPDKGSLYNVLNLPALSFVLWTIANLGPRALQTHHWYQDKFRESYPKSRKALVPLII
ncbi:hypothetical protein MP228_001747 [Amoeboaphelidium protococcarum]|nr:hypothetical protein MP228_001747 [Amoeboaphelidium protococcarum]